MSNPAAPNPPQADAKAAANLKQAKDSWDGLRGALAGPVPLRLRRAHSLVSGFRRRVR